ncbi:hypothetical protein ATN84_17010 [Paramesorhizobium deserti]|uniref:DUF1468 domain-containing protein n=1 Tax=Paramesorhizobium deserti TaxID=1494590 RepID=A0A135HS12_9HYPH|nr:hypothetical protein ATN84_17010 [Paramesorhizobium deserti]
MTDRLIGATGLAIAVFFAWRATLIEEPFISDPVGPRIFPLIICVLLGLASLGMLLRPDPEPDWPALPGLMEVAAGTVVLVAYAELLPQLGFIIATFFAAGYLAWRLGASPLRATLAGVTISLGIYAVFHLILGLALARGPFGF